MEQHPLLRRIRKLIDECELNDLLLAKDCFNAWITDAIIEKRIVTLKAALGEDVYIDVEYSDLMKRRGKAESQLAKQLSIDTQKSNPKRRYKAS